MVPATDELRRIYRQALAERIRVLEGALAELGRDPEAAGDAIRRVAHSLRGSGGTYGFPEVSAAAAAAEEAGPELLAAETARLLEVLRTVRGAAAAARVLVVDDDPEMRLLLRHVLASGEREVVFAASAAEAERRLRSERFHLLLLDLVLPDADGRTLLKRVPEFAGSDAPAVFVLSGKDAPTIREECLALGASAFFVKPFDPEALGTAVHVRLAEIA